MAKKRDRTPDMFAEKKEIPKMPEGYYSGDKPNPNLRKFVEEHIKEKPYDPATDDYNVPAFDKPIKSTKATAIYNMHTYWSKKPHDAIREYIKHYTDPGDLVLDPFCGSGGTALAALMEGRKAIAIDRSPAATFITKNYCTPVDTDELEEAFEELKEKVKPEIDWLYETKCDRCGGKAATAYTVYSQVFQCPRCLEKVALFDCVEIESHTAQGKPKKIKICPFCRKNGNDEEISTRTERFGAIPVLVKYICQENCKPNKGERRHNDLNDKKSIYFDEYDLGKIREIEDKDINYWYPNIDMIRGQETLRNKDISGKDWYTVSDLFTKRNLWALAIVRSYLADISSPLSTMAASALWTAITTVALTGTRMLREEKRAIQAGTYYLPQIFREIKIINGIDYNVFQLNKACNELNNLIENSPKIIISTQDAKNIGNISNTSIDYIFTDPPYSGKVQYGELNFVWEAWLGFDTHWHDEEIIVNQVRGKTEEDWKNMMKQAMSECYRVLKPGRWLSLCYHDTSEGTWALIQDIMSEVGFIVDKSDSALFIDTDQKSYNQKVAEKVTKRDLVINFRKPRPGEISGHIIITGHENKKTFTEKVKSIIKENLSSHPGSPMDRIYDEVVSRMVRRGEFERHNFLEILEETAEETEHRWYLRETADEIDKTEQTKEDKAAEILEDFMKKYLEENPSLPGVHYSDLFEIYLPVKDKPRRLLQEWMIDYFFKTPDGIWRPPQNEEEREYKEKLRQSGLLRGIKRFAASLMAGTPVRDKDRPTDDFSLAEWVRECRRAGLYEQGKVLYEKGGINTDNLDEERLLELEEDYSICVKRRGEDIKKRKKK